MPIPNIIKAFLRERKINSLREKKKDYLYVWFMGQEPNYNQLDGLIEAKQYLMEKARELKLSILLETTEKRLVKIYQRVGFEVYQTWEDQKTGLKVWFAKKEVA